MNTSIRRLLVVGGASAAALAVWALAVPVGGATLSVRTGGGGGGTSTVGPVAVVAASLLAGLAAWALRSVLERRTARPGRNWTITAVVVLLLSLTGPLANAVGTTPTLTLTLLHLAVAAVLIPGLARY